MSRLMDIADELQQRIYVLEQELLNEQDKQLVWILVLAIEMVIFGAVMFYAGAESAKTYKTMTGGLR